jgi:CDP-6-deoxy-D-xylo-4-hexulose-3-dehydrase
MAGLRVKLVDVDPRTLNVDVDALEAAITPRTRGLSLVHLLGNPCDMDRITALAQKHRLVILEDCCEALGAEWNGAPVGSFGAGAVFSFFFSHHITTMEGGMVVVDDDRHADVLRVLRAHGWLRNAPDAAPAPSEDIDPRYAFVNWGFNVRPTELQAGFGLHQLTKLPAFAARRRELAERFFGGIARIPFLQTPIVHPRATPSWLALPIVLTDDAPFSRSVLTAYLENDGVETRSVVAGNIARHTAAALFDDLAAGDLPGADLVHRRGFYVGLHPLVSDADLDRLLRCFESFVRRYTDALAPA